MLLLFDLPVYPADTVLKNPPDKNACRQYEQQDQQSGNRKSRFVVRHGITACFHKYGGRNKRFPSFNRDRVVTGTGQDCDRPKTLYQ